MGNGKGSCKSVAETVGAIICFFGSIVSLILLGLAKLFVGCFNLSSCLTSPLIPRYMTGAVGVVTAWDIIFVCTTCSAESKEFRFSGAALVHLIGIIIGSMFVFRDYSYLADVMVPRNVVTKRLSNLHSVLL